MSRENLLFAIIGILLGFIVGFIFASTMAQKNATTQTSASSQTMPADHPPISGAGPNAPGDPQAVRAEVAASLEKAKSEPNNFDAQLKAAELYYQIQRYDQAIEFLLKANQLQPTDYRTVAILGMVNLDAGHFETAEKWYRAALKMKADDTMVLAGLTEATLQRGDAKAAEDAIAKLEKVDPNSQDLPRFRDKLATLKSGK
ncbi:MAG TPA: tetratricopeptide repeat protein [Pyrinomonadaceae bacterium]|nr:tetratricopeptide repeat protein [Pyrinomonadaceae bacterium]